MRSALTGIRLFLLGLWLGSMAGFAFIFAPIAFAHAGPTPAFAATIAGCVRAVGVLGIVCGALTAGSTVAFGDEAPRVQSSIVACIAVAIAAALYETSAIVPHMETTPLLTPAYEALHRTSSSVYSIVLAAVTAAFFLVALGRRTDRRIG